MINFSPNKVRATKESFVLCFCSVLEKIYGCSVVKNLPANAGSTGLIPGSGRSPGEGHGNRLQYSCLKNSWTEEPGGLQSMGSKRVGHDLAIKTTTITNFILGLP